MKENKKLFKRIASFVLATLAVFAMTSISALAAESVLAAELIESAESAEVDTFAEPEVMPDDFLPVDTQDSNVIQSGMATIVNSATIKLELTQLHWGANFYVTVLGNQGAKYEVILTAPDGSQKVAYVAGGSSNLSLIATALYTQTGTYKFEFTRISGNASSARAIAEIHD